MFFFLLLGRFLPPIVFKGAVNRAIGASPVPPGRDDGPPPRPLSELLPMIGERVREAEGRDGYIAGKLWGPFGWGRDDPPPADGAKRPPRVKINMPPMWRRDP